MKLFMVMLGCKPLGRNTEQHDVFFGIARTLGELVPNMRAFWPDAQEYHIDAWREVKNVDNHHVKIKNESLSNHEKLYFINLGGYTRGKFQELHECCLIAAESLSKAIKKSKETEFYKNESFTGAHSHIDDKFAVAVDDAIEVSALLSKENSEGVFLTLEKSEILLPDDKLHIGYFRLEKIK